MSNIKIRDPGTFYNRHKSIINYLIVGILSTVVCLAVYYACVLTVLDPQHPLQLQAANVISWLAAVTFAYFTNRRFVFESNNPNKLQEAAKFFASRVGTLLIDMGTMFLLVTIIGMNHIIAKLIVQVIVIVCNFVFSKYLVFSR